MILVLLKTHHQKVCILSHVHDVYICIYVRIQHNNCIFGRYFGDEELVWISESYRLSRTDRMYFSLLVISFVRMCIVQLCIV